MSDTPNENPKPENDKGDFDVDLLRRLADPPPFPRKEAEPAAKDGDDDPLEEFWAAFSMITHTGERFTIHVCFRSRQHYNAEMHKFETAKNVHVVLKDANDESVVIKRDVLLHVLPSEVDEMIERKKKW